MLRPIHVGRNWPTQRPLDPNATFLPGMIAQHKLIGNEIVLGVSDGIAPFGIIEDVREVAHVRPSIDEIVVVTPDQSEIDVSTGVPALAINKIAFLKNANVLQHSFASDIPGVELIAINGAVSVVAGTVLNAKLSPVSTTNDSVMIRVRYSYYVPNRPGDDTTLGSNKVTVWPNPSGCIFSTDQYETAVPYPLNAALYVSSGGRLTTEQLMDAQPAVAMVCVPPTSVNPMLEFMWL